MRKVITILFALLLALAAAGCNNGGTATPTPAITKKPVASPSSVPATTGLPQTSPSADMSPSVTGGTGGVIEGFVEGNSVAVDKIPGTVSTAVLDKYPGATITAATYATYMGSQMYLVTLSGVDTERVYVSPDGTVTEYSASPTGE